MQIETRKKSFIKTNKKYITCQKKENLPMWPATQGTLYFLNDETLLENYF